MCHVGTCPVSPPNFSAGGCHERRPISATNARHDGRPVAECSKVDECKSWADKAKALASYARQAKDDSLRVMAVRIQARAERRAGELLKQIPRADEATRFGKDGTVPPVTRTQAAEDAGLSERQRKTALRISNIPEPQFEAALACSKPPTITQLAAQGTARREPEPPARTYVPDDIPPAPVSEALKAQSLLREFAAYCGVASNAAAIARACNSLDLESLHGYVETIETWLDQFVPNLQTA
jgi:hypothetical protein